MKRVPVLMILVFCGINSKSFAQRLYNAGFRSVRITDKARVYKTRSVVTNYLHYRPVDIDIWYPAIVQQTDEPLIFKYFLDQFAGRANYYTASRTGDTLTTAFSKSFCQGFMCSTPKKLLKVKTRSYKNALKAKGKFPVIVYMASFNSMGYENYQLFEQLAQQGFVIISIASVGRYPGDMTMNNEDLMEQVNDGVAALKYLRQSPNMDFSRLGILGYSWGGLAGVILASKIPGVDFLMSFEGSEFHHYGEDKNEDADFDGIKNSAAFKSINLKIPYLRFESVLPPTNHKDSVYNFTKKLSGDRHILEVNEANHQDFCSLPVVVKESGGCGVDATYNTIINLTVSYAGDILKKRHSFPQVLEQNINRTVKEVKR